jgi:hypothetical protein
MTTKTGATSTLRGNDTIESSTGGTEVDIESGDQLWLARLVGDRDRVRVRMQLATDTDTEGHAAATASDQHIVLVIISDEGDDVEGHALALHFPAVGDAQAFKKGLAAGALAATLVLGGAAGAVSLSQAIQASVPPPAAAPAVHRVTVQLHPQTVNPRFGRPIAE